MKSLYTFLLLVLLNTFLVQSEEEYCYSNDADKQQTKHYATKTAYELARGTDKRYFSVPNCEPVKFWLISRHGTRNPSAKSIKQLKNLTEVRDEIFENSKQNKVSKLCDEDLKLLESWRWDKNLTSSYENFLTVTGWNELKYMALHFQKQFPKVIEPRYSRDKFRFLFSDTQRTEASFKAFVAGLFGENKNIDIKPEGNESTLLRPYEVCPKWLEQEDTAKDTNSEYYKFQQTNIFKETLEEISTRLGLKYTLNYKQVDAIFDMCRYDQAWYLQDDSPWCAAFTPKNIEILEYNEDLKYYVKSGPGGSVNQNIMCNAVQDMLKFLGSDTNPKVVSYFSHASALQLFLTSLQYVKDDSPLRADNFEQMKNRKFKTSSLSPFASNIAVVKYFCANEQKKHKVQFFLNEKPMDFLFCKIGLCDLEDVLEKYDYFLHADCDSIFCGNSANFVNLSFLMVFLGTIVLYIM